MLHTPLTLFHASFLPICSTFSHLSLLILHHFSKPVSPPHTTTASLLKSKIRKRSWVLHECVERVPENVDAAKELLQYGLKGTDLEALIAIGNGEDGGRCGTPHQPAFMHIPRNRGFFFLFFFARLRHVSSAASHFCARFIIPGDVDLDDAPYEDFLPLDEELERKEERESSRRGELLAKVHFSR